MAKRVKASFLWWPWLYDLSCVQPHFGDIASLDKSIDNDYLCLVALNKQKRQWKDFEEFWNPQELWKLISRCRESCSVNREIFLLNRKLKLSDHGACFQLKACLAYLPWEPSGHYFIAKKLRGQTYFVPSASDPRECCPLASPQNRCQYYPVLSDRSLGTCRGVIKVAYR